MAIVIAAAALAFALPAVAQVRAEPFSDDQRSEIEGIIKEYLMRIPK